MPSSAPPTSIWRRPGLPYPGFIRIPRSGCRRRIFSFRGGFTARAIKIDCRRSRRSLSPGKPPRLADQELARIIDCALKLLNKDLDGVIDGMSRIAGPDERARPGVRDEPNIYDPGLLEFSVEILADALKLASQPGPQAAGINKDKLVGIQNRLISYLRRVRMSEWASR